MYHLLIVDDEADERNLLRFLLRDYSHIIYISEAKGGSEALAILDQEHTDIIISDIQMPFMGGIEFATKARERFPDIEILFISGYDDFPYVQSALSLKASNYILKPVNQQDFHDSIENILKRLDSNVLEYTKSEQYIERNFHDLAEKVIPNEESSQTAVIEDHILLQNVKSAVQNKQPEQLKEAVMSFIQKYQVRRDISHIYIRYVCTSLLQAMNPSRQAFPISEMEQAIRDIYSYRYFSDIRSLLEEYLQKAIAVIEEGKDTQNFAVNQVKQYIRENYEKDLSLNMLADLVYLSPNYLGNMFVKNTGININKYIRKVRMEKARELLCNTNMKISDISNQIGYPSTSYFCKLFMEEYGVTPEKFRTSV